MGGGAFPAISTREPWDGKDGEVSPATREPGDGKDGQASPATREPWDGKDGQASPATREPGDGKDGEASPAEPRGQDASRLWLSFLASLGPEAGCEPGLCIRAAP